MTRREMMAGAGGLAAWAAWADPAAAYEAAVDLSGNNQWSVLHHWRLEIDSFRHWRLEGMLQGVRPISARAGSILAEVRLVDRDRNCSLYGRAALMRMQQMVAQDQTLLRVEGRSHLSVRPPQGEAFVLLPSAAVVRE